MIDFKVFSDSTGTDTSGADLGILNFELVEMTELYFKVQIIFQKPEMITKNVMAPDVLEIELKLGDIFIDSEDF